jgi:putative PIN family toxin of toxin-antitoxin system
MAATAAAPARRLLLDTNVVVGALLWRGPPWRLMEMAVEEGLELVGSPALMVELQHTLSYPKFAGRLALLQADVATLMNQYQAITTLADPADVPRVVPGDTDDDHVIAAAVAARVDLIVSGDRHLLTLGSHEGIAIVTVRQALERLGAT